jgi:tetratricopeptide (TPR) repeat protein
LQAAAKAPNKDKDHRVSLFRMLAESYDNASDTTLAVAAYKRYISAAASPDPNASYRLARLSESSDPSLAGKMYERNAARFPTDYRNYFDAARQYSRQSATYDKAIVMIRKCISMRDTVPYLWLVLGRIYGKRNATALELKAYQNYLLGEATNAGASEDIGNSLLERDMAKQAAQYLENAYALAPHNPDYALSLAQCYEKTGRMSDALVLAAKADSLKPDDVKIKNFANYLRLRMGKNGSGDTVQ